MKASASEASPFGPGNPSTPSFSYLFLRFLRYGALAWGGPVAQIGLMHRELVSRDRWISEERFRKTLALYQALPGPEAHELAVYFGVLKRGRLGGFLTGLGFMLPGVLLVTLLAALYVRFSFTLQASTILLYGVKPAVIALVAMAIVRIGRANLTSATLALVAMGAFAVGTLWPHINFLLLLAGGGALGFLEAFARRKLQPPSPPALGLTPWILFVSFPALSLGGLAALSILSLKVGLLTFGGAYTAIPFLHQGAVVEQAWMTNEQFLDALALSSLVPGPLIAVGTFVGYQAAGFSGATLATLLIFTPAFGFTLLGHRFFERVIEEPRLHAFLLGITAAMVGLIGATTLPLARSAFAGIPTLVIGILALGALATRRVPIPFVILLSALLGALWQLL